MFLNERKGLLGVEPLHHHHRATEGLHAEHIGQRRGVVERGGRQVDAVGGQAIAVNRLAGGEALGRGDLGQGAQDALGPPCRARGVEHGVAHPLLRQGFRRGAGQGVLVGLPAGDGPAHHQADGAVGDQVGQGGGQVPLLVGGHQGLGPAVADDVGGLVGGQVAVDGGDVEPRPEARPDRVHEGQVVLHQDRDVVAPAQAPGPEELGHAVGALVELAVGHHRAGVGGDQGRLVGRQPGVVGQVHGLTPLAARLGRGPSRTRRWSRNPCQARPSWRSPGSGRCAPPAG